MYVPVHKLLYINTRRCRAEPPESFRKALVAPCGPRKVRPIAGGVKFGKSRLHGRGVFADQSYREGEVVECPDALYDDLSGSIYILLLNSC